MSDTDHCSRCRGDCGMSNCPECGGCENTGVQPCPDCQPGPIGTISDGDWDDEPCDHDCTEDCYDEYGEPDCRHQHCFNCGGCNCPGYCDDYQSYNLRPAETGGSQQ
jgi:hypothetical protein